MIFLQQQRNLHDSHLFLYSVSGAMNLLYVLQLPNQSHKITVPPLKIAWTTTPDLNKNYIHPKTRIYTVTKVMRNWPVEILALVDPLLRTESFFRCHNNYHMKAAQNTMWPKLVPLKENKLINSHSYYLFLPNMVQCILLLQISPVPDQHTNNNPQNNEPLLTAKVHEKDGSMILKSTINPL